MERIRKELDACPDIISEYKGSELLGKLKQQIDIETIAAERLWELLNDEDGFVRAVAEAQCSDHERM